MWGKKDLDHRECSNEKKCPKCQQDHLAYSRACDIYKKEKEILAGKHKKNVTFLDASKIKGSYMGENTYASIAQRVDLTRQNNHDNKYRETKLIRTDRLTKVLGAPEKLTLSRISSKRNKTNRNPNK